MSSERSKEEAKHNVKTVIRGKKVTPEDGEDSPGKCQHLGQGQVSMVNRRENANSYLVGCRRQIPLESIEGLRQAPKLIQVENEEHGPVLWILSSFTDIGLVFSVHRVSFPLGPLGRHCQERTMLEDPHGTQ